LRNTVFNYMQNVYSELYVRSILLSKQKCLSAINIRYCTSHLKCFPSRTFKLLYSVKIKKNKTLYFFTCSETAVPRRRPPMCPPGLAPLCSFSCGSPPPRLLRSGSARRSPLRCAFLCGPLLCSAILYSAAASPPSGQLPCWLPLCLYQKFSLKH